MKKNIFTFLIFLTTALIIFSCEKEIEKPIDLNGSYLKINEVAYNINDGLIENFGEIGDQNVYEIRVSLYSELLALGTRGKVTSLSGTGNVVFLKMFSSHADSLDIGEYYFNYSNNVNTFKDPKYIINWDATDKKARWTNIVEGKVNVTKNDDYYEIIVKGKDEFGNNLQCVYKGILKYFY